MLGKTGILSLLLILGACGKAGPAKLEQARAGWLQIDLDQSDPGRLLRYYFGGYAAAGGADPFAQGLVIEQQGRFYVDAGKLDTLHPGTVARMREAARGGRLGWEGLSDVLRATYYAARQAPPTLAALRAEVPYRDDEEAWFHVAIDGVMTTARRHVYAEIAALRYALSHYREHGDRLLYPVGTTLVGEHYLDGEHIETTVMRKREDGFWDFFTFDSKGALSDETQALPRALKTPTECVGCHFGQKPFEPERSFPGEAPPGPHGPRVLYVDDALRDAEAVRFFDEHRRRSDTVLGIYNTLFVARLRANRRAGRLSEADAHLLDELGL